MTIHWKAVEQYFTVVLFNRFLILPSLQLIFGKCINFGLELSGVKGLRLEIVDISQLLYAF